MEIKDASEKVIERLKTVKDPELSLDVWTLGLIYDITHDDTGIEILMTLTSPFCPFADDLIQGVEECLQDLIDTDKGQTVRVELVFDPPWEPSAKLRKVLGL